MEGERGGERPVERDGGGGGEAGREWREGGGLESEGRKRE